MADIDIKPDELGSRPMPDFVRRGLITVQGGQRYLKAPYRVLWMREEHPDWSIVTSVVYADWDKGFAVVQASILDASGRVLATAHSEEARGKLPYLKKAETGAIARALALCGYGTQFGESEDEEFADSPQDTGQGTDRNRPAEIKPGKCPECKAVNSHSPTCSKNPANARAAQTT